MESLVLALCSLTDSKGLLEKDQKECGQLASPVDGSLVCADNNIHTQNFTFRLKSCKVLCQPGYQYPQNNETVFYCSSDYGYWYEYPSEEVLLVADCNPSDYNYTLEERDIMRILEKFTDSIILGRITLNDKIKSKDKNNMNITENKGVIASPKNKSKHINTTTAVQREITFSPEDYYYIPRIKNKPVAIIKNYFTKKKEKQAAIPVQKDTKDAKNPLITEKNYKNYDNKNIIEGVKYIMNIVSPKVKESERKYNFYDPSYFEIPPQYNFNSIPTLSSSQRELFPVNPSKNYNGIMQTPSTITYDTTNRWKDLENFPEPKTTKKPPSIADDSWKYFENKNNPAISKNNIYKNSHSNNYDGNSYQWKRDKYYADNNKTKTGRIKKFINSNNVKHKNNKKSSLIKKSPHKKNILRKGIKIVDLAKSDLFKNLKKDQRQKLQHLLKRYPGKKMILDSICKEIPNICVVGNKIKT
ncbi:hypothetical protein HZS_125, partial [Henneguya salminicola]